MPYFSVIVPMYNRERLIGRCLDSVLAQSFDDYEVIVVDDGSADGSADRVRGYADPRIRLLLHERNQGMQPARRTAIAASAGEWQVILDSDDELSDADALRRMHDRMQSLKPDIKAVAFASRMDNGRPSPDPPCGETRDYAGYMRFMEERVPGDKPTAALDCTRRDCPDIDLGLAENRGYEELYLLEFHLRFRSRMFPDVCRLYHQDADNQLVKAATRDPQRDRQLARDRLVVIEAALARHGQAMRRMAPKTYWLTVSRAAVLNFAVGSRAKAIRHSMIGLRLRPFHPRSWAVPVFGLAGDGALRRGRQIARRLRERAMA